MPTSIRKFLLINLLLAITITTTLTAIGNYYLDEKDIQEHLDIDMAISALSYQALLGNDIHQRQLNDIQTRLNKMPKEIGGYFKKPLLDNQTPDRFLSKFSFQLLTDDGKMLLHSSTTPKFNLKNKKDGFIDTTIDKNKWRLFTTKNPSSGTRTILAERYDTRKELGTTITQDDLYIMLLTFPLSGLLIWIIIGRGLDSLDRVAEEVSNRAPGYLEPVSINKVPDEIKPVIDEINKLLSRLQEAFDREKRFAADAAHELRTPLASIKTQAQIGINSHSLEEKDEALHKLISSVDRSTHVVNQLLTMSKLTPESGAVNDLSKISITKITKETIATLVPSAIEKDIEIIFEQDKSVHKIEGNATAISILVRNLVDNAIRYAHSGGEVVVRVYENNHEILLEVRDNGPGIPDELRARVFERFFRVLGNKSPGSGLGLGIVQQICSLHNAKVELKSPETGTGLIIIIRFPTKHQTM